MGKHEAVVSAAISPALVVPEDVIDFIGKPSLLQTEAVADYDALLLRLAEAVKPKDAVEWIWIADVTHLVWEMRRLRSMRDAIIVSEFTKGLSILLSHILSADYDSDVVNLLRNRLISHWNSRNPFRQRIAQRFMMRRGVDLRQRLSFEYCNFFDRFIKLDDLITNLGRRRDSVLREIERRRDTVARRLRDVTDAEFEITKPGTQPVGN